MSAPLLPVSSLGKEYVIPAFDVSIFSRAEIMIATGYWTASVNVTRKGGTVTSYELAENQTLSVAHEAAGMSVSSSREIAVFTENEYKGSYERYIYSQLTPSDDFGNEYVLAVGSLATKHFIFVDNFTEEYFVNITCLFNETTIIFNDGLTVIIAEAKFYHKDVKVNGSLQFSTSKPVMAYLCLKVEFHHDDEISQENPCTILKPVEQYGDSALISIPAKAELKIMTKQDNDGFHGFSLDHEHQSNMPFITKWKNIPNADFKVGTVTVDKGIIYMKSTSKFSVIVYGFDIHNFPEHGVLLSISTSLPSDPLRTPLHSPTTGINVTAIVIGSVGFIILAFGSIIVFLLFRRRRKRKSKSSTETRKNPEERGTSSEGDQSVPETPEQGSDVTEVHTYSDLNFEGQTVNEYQKIHHKSDKQTSDYTNM